MNPEVATPEDSAGIVPLPFDSAGFMAWRGLIFSSSRLMRELDDELQSAHNLSLGDFDVLRALYTAPDRRRRMCDLADAVVLSASGLSRRVDRLERAGWACRERSDADGRSIETVLTAEGAQFFARVSDFHLSGVRRLFAERFSEEELETLASLLGRIEESSPQSGGEPFCLERQRHPTVALDEERLSCFAWKAPITTEGPFA